MRSLVLILVVLMLSIIGCTSAKSIVADKSASKNDTVRIANDSLEYEVIIIDPGFNSWLASTAKPRNFYGQSYLESRNLSWVYEWNRRARNSFQYSRDLYQMEIDYRPGINYGYEVNYLLFNYLVYFQQTNRQRLGSFQPNP
ncbi:DUF6146 family protein [Flavobacterium silvaticum]|uniref:Lipoprotein n=1 Tax=Flavobacterium silvaticum TaxID=1852020 RepID=A0A972FRT6_9FLAO|nr:DUF6146 family protein [Flavobacterium silvaticum]NMH26827.1 hypothetical protein [Flavobacterium silvaticum]